MAVLVVAQTDYADVTTRIWRTDRGYAAVPRATLASRRTSGSSGSFHAGQPSGLFSGSMVDHAHGAQGRN